MLTLIRLCQNLGLKMTVTVPMFAVQLQFTVVLYNIFVYIQDVPSVLWRCWLGGRKGIRPVKTEWWDAGIVICLERGADLHTAQLMPLPLTVSCFSRIQIGFTFLVPAHPDSPGKRAAKRVCVCLCVFRMCKQQLSTWKKFEHIVMTSAVAVSRWDLLRSSYSVQIRVTCDTVVL